MSQGKCAVPTYMMPARDVAVSCGKQNGMVTAIILTVITFFILLLGEKEEGGEKKTELRWQRAFIGTPLVGLASYLLFPWLFGMSNGSQWEASQAQIEEYMRGGFTRAEALKQMQKMKMAQMQADATRDAGTSISAAILAK